MSDIDPASVHPQDPSGGGESTPLAPPVLIAIADLASRLDIDAAEVVVISHEEVDWPDGSLGCPQLGMRYKQMIVNGTLTVLEVGGVEYRYPAGGGRDPFLCVQAPKTETPPATLSPRMGSGPLDE